MSRLFVHLQRSWLLRMGLLAVLGSVALGASPAYGYDFYVNTTTIGQGYQLRAADGTLLDKRRLTQYVRLGIYGLLDPDAPDPFRRGSPSDAPSIGFVASFRFDTDFGLSDEAVRRITPQLDYYYNAFNLLYAYFYGRNFLRGFFEWEIGRQFVIDMLDWYSFDGATVRFVLKPIYVSVEAFGGLEVKDDGPLPSSVFMLDGTAVTANKVDPFSEQNRALSPMVGVALMSNGLRFLQTRFSYRRTWSVTRDPAVYGESQYIAPLPNGMPAPVQVVPAAANSGIEEEKIAYSATVFPYYPKTTIRLSGGFRYNLLLAQFDDIRGAADFQFFPHHTIGLEYYRIRPDFIGDSIFNVFSTQATEDVHGRYSWRFAKDWELAARGTFRLYEAVYPPVSGDLATPQPGNSVREGGGGLGVRFWRGHRQLRGEFNWVTGYGGHRGGVDIAGRYPVWGERLRLEGRVNWVNWEDDLRNPVPAGTQSFDSAGNSLGLQAGATWVIWRGVVVHLLLEENINKIYASQFRVAALLDLSLWR